MGDDGAMTATMLSQREGLKVLRQTFAVSSESHRQAIDITGQVRDALQSGEVHSGLVIANCLHTTCSVLIAKFRPALLEEIAGLMNGLVDDEARYKHNDPRLSDCERGNAAAHLRASLLGHGVALGITDGDLLLDGSESILLAEFDGPRERRIHVQVLGV
jgi:secondary thiamine-phosphate synthase enzyme